MILLTESCLDLNIKPLLDLNSTKIILLENLRFHAEEEENDFEFAKKLDVIGFDINAERVNMMKQNITNKKMNPKKGWKYTGKQKQLYVE